MAARHADDGARVRESVLAALRRNGNALKDVDEALKRDREIVLAAVQQAGHALQYADEPLRKDRTIVLEAVKQNGHALQHADEALRNDRAIVLEAVLGALKCGGRVGTYKCLALIWRHLPS